MSGQNFSVLNLPPGVFRKALPYAVMALVLAGCAQDRSFTLQNPTCILACKAATTRTDVNVNQPPPAKPPIKKPPVKDASK
jgi:hypothetical protein